MPSVYGFKEVRIQHYLVDILLFYCVFECKWKWQFGEDSAKLETLRMMITLLTPYTNLR